MSYRFPSSADIRDVYHSLDMLEANPQSDLGRKMLAEIMAHVSLVTLVEESYMSQSKLKFLIETVSEGSYPVTREEIAECRKFLHLDPAA